MNVPVSAVINLTNKQTVDMRHGRERCRVHKKEKLHIIGQHDTDTIEKWTIT